ncbi:alpha/beta hydrolase [Novosphingobium sp. 18052]|uniref:alpha/beta hydrolase n=1 Tax=Novosphingobium sp. 18052 TaxID=2681400 RepID=UPI00351AD9EF
MACLFAVAPLSAQVIEYETVEVVADHFDSGGERSLFLTFRDAPTALSAVFPAGPAYGPFRVLGDGRAALVDVTDARSPGQFAAMLRDYPGITSIEMIDCPGTEDDLANLRLGRMIREHGIATHVPAGGSVRSGGVELFLAGAHRYADAGAEFAVHSWMDDTGLEPDDYASNAPENRRYIDYYRQMGMSPIEADAFYAMTNSVPFSSARWFGAGEMGLWVRLEGAGA